MKTTLAWRPVLLVAVVGCTACGDVSLPVSEQSSKDSGSPNFLIPDLQPETDPVVGSTVMTLSEAGEEAKTITVAAIDGEFLVSWNALIGTQHKIVSFQVDANAKVQPAPEVLLSAQDIAVFPHVAAGPAGFVRTYLDQDVFHVETLSSKGSSLSNANPVTAGPNTHGLRLSTVGTSWVGGWMSRASSFGNSLEISVHLVHDGVKHLVADNVSFDNSSAIVDVTGAEDGWVLVSWAMPQPLGQIILGRFYDTATQTFPSQAFNISGYGGDQTTPRVVSLGGTDYAVTWQDHENGGAQIRLLQRTDGGGAHFPDEAVSITANDPTSHVSHDSAIAHVLACNGEPVAVYSVVDAGGLSSIWIRRFTEGLEPVEVYQSTAPAEISSLASACNDRGLLLGWVESNKAQIMLTAL